MKKSIFLLSIISSFSAYSAEIKNEQTYSYHDSWSVQVHWNRDVSNAHDYMIANGNDVSAAHIKGDAFTGWTVSGLNKLSDSDKSPKTNAYHFEDKNHELNPDSKVRDYSASYQAVSDKLESGVISFTINPKEAGLYQARLFTHTKLGGYGVEVCQSGECKNIQLAQGTIPYTSHRTLIEFDHELSPVQVNIFRRVGSGNDSRKEIYLDAVVLNKVN